MAGCSDMRVLYPLDMGEPRINRETWAAIIAQVLEVEAGGNKTHLARLLGVNRRTIDRWLTMAGDASEENVAEVARRLSLSVSELLVRVGYYSSRELAEPAPVDDPKAVAGAGQLSDAPGERSLELIEAAAIPPSLKRELREQVVDMQRRHAEERAEHVERALRMYARAAGRSV